MCSSRIWLFYTVVSGIDQLNASKGRVCQFILVVLIEMYNNCLISRPYWVVRSHLWYDVLSVCRLSVCL